MKENPNLTKKKKKKIILTEFKDLACPLILYTHLRSFFLWKILTKKKSSFWFVRYFWQRGVLKSRIWK